MDPARAARFRHARFPRASRYDPDWILANEMGPNALWLAEALCQRLEVSSGMRVLDMGCGRAMTSIFLAKEFGTRVWANDLWIKAEDNWSRIREAGLEDLVCPIHAEAHDLPYAAGFFDLIFSIDSYQYYGTDDLYLPYILRFLRDRGRIAIVVPGLLKDFDDGGPPAYLTRKQASGGVFWVPSECATFHTVEWWRRHFERAGLVDVEHAAPLEDGCGLWLQWEQAREGAGFSGFPSDVEVLEQDAGSYLGFHVIVARKR